MKEYTRKLAEFAAGLTYEETPGDVIRCMKRSVLDSIGCCLYGTRLPWTKIVADMALANGSRPEATLFGTGRQCSIADAVLANATAGHAFELDDIHTESVLHPGSIALPVALAFAEKDGNWSGRDLITALVAGYETGIRVGNAATTQLFFRGFHPQGASGVFVSAATAAHCLGLDASQTQQTLGIAGSQAGGLMAAQEGAMVKRFHAGRAAQSGVYAAQLAARGFTGIQDVLEAEYGGFLSSYSGSPALHRLDDGLGTTWETSKMGYKLYASVTSIHCALEALKRILRENGLSAQDIRKVAVGVGHMTHVHCAWDYHAQSVTAAQMNLYYGLAAIALYGDAFVHQYTDDRISRKEIFDFITRIEVAVDPEIEAQGPAARHAAVVTVTPRQGASHTLRLESRHGSAADPASDLELTEKFRKLTSDLMAPATADAIIESVLHLEEQETLDDLLGMINRVIAR